MNPTKFLFGISLLASVCAANAFQNSGGPVIQQIWPGPDTRIDEEQVFVMQLNSPATLASVQASLWCAADGLGERVASLK